MTEENWKEETVLEKSSRKKKPPPKSKAYLKLMIDDSISYFPVDRENYIIGRSDDCCLTLNDVKISRIHCRILNNEDTFILEDLGSKNGTKVNGLFVKKKILNNGDQIQVGDIKLSFEI